jgi:hypothetical protein
MVYDKELEGFEYELKDLSLFCGDYGQRQDSHVDYDKLDYTVDKYSHFDKFPQEILDILSSLNVKYRLNNPNRLLKRKTTERGKVRKI